jgi:hypothetical protein
MTRMTRTRLNDWELYIGFGVVRAFSEYQEALLLFYSRFARGDSRRSQSQPPRYNRSEAQPVEADP